MGMNSGYCGWSRSKRASAAEREGKRPLSRFVQLIRPEFPGVTAADVRAVIQPCEWHHTSKMVNPTDYYDPREILVDHPDCQCSETPPCNDTCVCCECGLRHDAADNAKALRERIAKRKLLKKLIRQHGHDGRFAIMLTDGEVWHHVDQTGIHFLGRVLATINRGGFVRDSGEGQRIEEEELRKAGF